MEAEFLCMANVPNGYFGDRQDVAMLYDPETHQIVAVWYGIYYNATSRQYTDAAEALYYLQWFKRSKHIPLGLSVNTRLYF